MPAKGPKYFKNNNSTNKGEIYELRLEMQASSKEKKKTAISKAINFMSIGKDMSDLFPDIVNCLSQTYDVATKKLIYLFILNYAKTQPELAILAVNSFRKDATDANPIIRALSIRVMSYIRLPNIIEYLFDPLKSALTDVDPFVRKTAVVAVGKIYEICPEQVEDQDLIDNVFIALTDGSPIVVSNAVSVLNEILHRSNYRPSFNKLSKQQLQHLILSLEEGVSPYGQMAILDLISNSFIDLLDDKIIHQISGRLSHESHVVSTSCLRLFLKISLTDKRRHDLIFHKYRNSLNGTIISVLTRASPPTIFSVIRGINLVLVKYHGTDNHLLSGEVRMFFVRYDDPIYIKYEKIYTMVLLCTTGNVKQVLIELKEYASDVDIQFVRHTVRAIGVCALKLPAVADHCINVLLSLIESRVSYVVQEAIVIIKDLFRNFPGKYESTISYLCEHLEDLNDVSAKSAMIWIIGEYADRIDNATDLLYDFLSTSTFFDESRLVQHEILIAVVKLFLKLYNVQPAQCRKILSVCLQYITEYSSDPDLRDRGYYYWRLLKEDPNLARSIVLGKNQPELKKVDSFHLMYYSTSRRVTGGGGLSITLNESTRNEMIGLFGHLSGTLYTQPDSFVSDGSIMTAVMMRADDANLESDSESVRLEKIRRAGEQIIQNTNAQQSHSQLAESSSSSESDSDTDEDSSESSSGYDSSSGSSGSDDE